MKDLMKKALTDKTYRTSLALMAVALASTAGTPWLSAPSA
jgi:hypothetical protein